MTDHNDELHPGRGEHLPTVVASQAQGVGFGNLTVSRRDPVPGAEPGSALRANSRLSVGERVSPCPKAGCGKTARPV